MTCPDCYPQPVNHVQKWVDGLMSLILPSGGSCWKFLDRGIERAFVGLGLVTKDDDATMDLKKIFLRTSVVIEEGRKAGIKFWAFKGPYGYINSFEMEVDGKRFSFEGLPRAEFLESKLARIVDDKAAVKKVLLKHGLPTPEGKSFWFFRKGAARRYGLKIGFPLVVKPRSGSLTHHVTLNIRTPKELDAGLRCAFVYEPCCIVERYVPNASLHRVTVVDGEFVACVQRVAAHVVGDGAHTISELIAEKNRDPRRAAAGRKDAILYQLVVNDVTERVLAKQGFNLDSVPPVGQTVGLQEKTLLDLGGSLVELTPRIHPENKKLCERVAEIFGVKLVGLDVLAEDISKPWQTQPFAIIELNSLPFIDMHHGPSDGEPVNVAARIIAMVKKYYR